MNTETARIIIADDHAGIRAIVRRILAKEYNVVAAAADGQAFVEAALGEEADLWIIDIDMPIHNGLYALRSLRKRGMTTPALILTTADDHDLVREALDAGAIGYVVKQNLATDLRPAVVAALNGVLFLSKSLNYSEG